MHAAAAGKAPLFREVFHAMEMALTDEQVTVVSGLKTCSRLVHVEQLGGKVFGGLSPKATPLLFAILRAMLYACYRLSLKGGLAGALALDLYVAHVVTSFRHALLLPSFSSVYPRHTLDCH